MFRELRRISYEILVLLMWDLLNMDSVFEYMRPCRSVDWSQYFGAILTFRSGRTVIQTWARENRRFPGLPSKKRIGPRNLRVGVLVEVTGSIDEKTIESFIRETIEAFNIARLDPGDSEVIFWDETVHEVFKIREAYESKSIKTTGKSRAVIDDALRVALERCYDIVVIFASGHIEMTNKTRELASRLRSSALDAFFVYTDVFPMYFETWIPLCYKRRGEQH